MNQAKTFSETLVLNNEEQLLALQTAFEQFHYSFSLEELTPFLLYESKQAIKSVLLTYEANTDRITNKLVNKIHQYALEQLALSYSY